MSNEINLEGNITEQRMIEMANHFKEIMDEKEREIKRIKAKHKERERLLYKLVGSIDILYDSLIHLQNVTDFDLDENYIMIHKLLEYLHNECNDI